MLVLENSRSDTFIIGQSLRCSGRSFEESLSLTVDFQRNPSCQPHETPGSGGGGGGGGGDN